MARKPLIVIVLAGALAALAFAWWRLQPAPRPDTTGFAVFQPGGGLVASLPLPSGWRARYDPARPLAAALVRDERDQPQFELTVRLLPGALKAYASRGAPAGKREAVVSSNAEFRKSSRGPIWAYELVLAGARGQDLPERCSPATPGEPCDQQLPAALMKYAEAWGDGVVAYDFWTRGYLPRLTWQMVHNAGLSRKGQ